MATDIAPESMTDEELWERYFVLRRAGGWHDLFARFDKRLWHHAYQMASNNRYSVETARDIADEFSQWCRTAGTAERKFARFKPERGFKLTTYFRYIRNSLWAAFYKRHLREQIEKKHPGSHGAFAPSVGEDAEPGRLPPLADDSPSQEEMVVLRQTIAELRAAVQELSAEDAFLIEALHLPAFDGRFGPTAAGYLSETRKQDPEAAARTIADLDRSEDATAVRRYLAEFIGISVNALYVRDHRVRRQLREALTKEDYDETP